MVLQPKLDVRAYAQRGLPRRNDPVSTRSVTEGTWTAMPQPVSDIVRYRIVQYGLLTVETDK